MATPANSLTGQHDHHEVRRGDPGHESGDRSEKLRAVAADGQRHQRADAEWRGDQDDVDDFPEEARDVIERGPEAIPRYLTQSRPATPRNTARTTTCATLPSAKARTTLSAPGP